jgi:hypothetical protein
VFLGEAEGLDGEAAGLGEVGDTDVKASGDVGVPGGVGVPGDVGVTDADGEGVGVARISCHCQSSPV